MWKVRKARPPGPSASISVARRWSAGQPLPTAVRPSAFHSATVIQREWRACTRGQVGDTAVPAIARLSLVAGTPTSSPQGSPRFHPAFPRYLAMEESELPYLFPMHPLLSPP